MKLSVVILPGERWHQSREHWRRADEWNVHAGYTYDHLSWRSFREKPWFSMVPILAAGASVTTRLRLGPLVTTPNFRHPLVLAKELLSIDDISDGRLIVGVGAGGTGFDASVLGQEAWSSRQRHERFEEFTRALERLLRESHSDLQGAHFRIVDSRQIPGPVQLPRPPLYVSALGPRSLALAAELAEGWVSFGSPTASSDVSTFAAVSQQVTTLNAALASRGREASSLHRVILNFGGDETPMASYEAFLDWAGRYGELGFDEAVVHWPVPDSEYAYDESLFERICTDAAAHIAKWS